VGLKPFRDFTLVAMLLAEMIDVRASDGVQLVNGDGGRALARNFQAPGY